MDDATQISPGLIEVDEELMWCTEVDPDANLIYVSVRGMYGSTAGTHLVGSLCRNNPKYPRHAIKQAINNTLRSTYPDLFGVASVELVANSGLVTYELPAEVEQVLDVTYEQRDASGYWVPVRRYALDMNANTSTYPNGKTITVFEPVISNRLIQVTYRKVPSPLSALTDLLTSTGLSDSAKECLVYGACARLVGYVEPGRLSNDMAEARFIDTEPPGSATNAARYFYQLYLQAKSEEARRLLDRYPARIHFVR